MKNESVAEKEYLCELLKLKPENVPPATKMVREIRKLLEVRELSVISQD